MRKLVLLVIAVVAIAHVGFVAYMSADRQKTLALEEFNRSGREILPAFLKRSENTVEDAESEENPSSVDTAVEERPDERTPSRMNGKRSRDGISARAGSRTSETSTMGATNAIKIPAFPPPRSAPVDEADSMERTNTITIWYPGELRSRLREQVASPAVKAIPPQKENRSFVDRVVVPIFKKPYRLIKAIGSKLN